ncbi:MAG: 23S rRNA (guanosine(2251)-2'-O)-methyltransferase RlmB [Kistimonas sp.]|nr:23S rRNA (guanosine(2251)-2'-O)-methyltransferase RlmB [Kistimonas sp.]
MNDDAQEDLAFGLHAVEAVLEAQPERIQTLWCQKGVRNRRLEALVERARAAGIRVLFESADSLNRRAGGVHQRVVAQVQAAPVYRESDLPGLLDKMTEPPLLLVLDGVTDPHNLGACLRSADAAGVHAVIVPRARSAPLNATARKVACGAADRVPLVTVANLARCLRFLNQQGIAITGAAGEAGHRLYDADLRGAQALVMGAEQAGLRRLTREHCDQLVCIPMAGTVSSLNVSVATGVCLFEARRQREQIAPQEPG